MLVITTVLTTIPVFATEYEIVSDEKLSSEKKYSVQYLGDKVYRFNYSCGYLDDSGAILNDLENPYIILSASEPNGYVPNEDVEYISLPLKYKVSRHTTKKWCTIDMRIPTYKNVYLCYPGYYSPPYWDSTPIPTLVISAKYIQPPDIVPPTLEITQQSGWQSTLAGTRIMIQAEDSLSGIQKIEYKVN